MMVAGILSVILRRVITYLKRLFRQLNSFPALFQRIHSTALFMYTICMKIDAFLLYKIKKHTSKQKFQNIYNNDCNLNYSLYNNTCNRANSINLYAEIFSITFYIKKRVLYFVLFLVIKCTWC